MKQKYKSIQFIEISMHEIFCFQDKLDAVKDNPEKVWEVVDNFFSEAENQLELDPKFLQELCELELDYYDSIDGIDDLWKEKCEKDYNPSHMEVLKDYITYKKNQKMFEN